VPNLASGVWVGGEDRAVHFKSITQGQGATMALPIWAIYHRKLYADPELNISLEEFEKPEDLSIQLDCDGMEEGLEDDDIDDNDLEGKAQEEEEEEEIEF